MRIFLAILACDTSALFTIYMSLSTCKFGLHTLFASTVYFDTSCERVLDSLMLLGRSNSVLTIFYFSGTTGLQFCICLDLILTLKKPFAPKEARVKYYYGVSLIHASISATLIAIYDTDLKKDWLQKTVSFSSTCVCILIWIMSIASIVYGCIKLGKPNISKRVRRMILARHIITILFFLLVSFYLQISMVVTTISTQEAE